MDRLISQLPFFTDEHRNLAQSVAQFVAQEIEPRASAEDDIEGLAREFVQLLAREGILNYAVTESKLDIRALCLIREELAYSSALADLAFVMQGLGTYAIARAAPDHVRDFWLQRAANGKSIAAFALTEPNAGSDVAGIQTTARRDGETYVIEGRKRFISNAGIRDKAFAALDDVRFTVTTRSGLNTGNIRTRVGFSQREGGNRFSVRGALEPEVAHVIGRGARNRVRAETLHDEREIRECRRVGEFFANQTERANVELRLSDGVVQNALSREQLDELY